MNNTKHPSHYYKTQRSVLKIIITLACIGYACVLAYAYRTGDVIAARTLTSIFVLTSVVVFSIAKFVDK